MLRPSDEHAYPKLEEAVRAVAEELDVVVQFSSDIDRWSSIAIPARRFRTRSYRRIGRLSAHRLDPACWAVDKLARYRESDIDDLVAVLKREKLSERGFRDGALTSVTKRASDQNTM